MQWGLGRKNADVLVTVASFFFLLYRYRYFETAIPSALPRPFLNIEIPCTDILSLNSLKQCSAPLA